MNMLSSQANSDFKRARFQTIVRRFLGVKSDRSPELLSFEEIKDKLQIRTSIYRGIKTVRVDQILGSVNRYHEYDREFRPFKSISSTRRQSVNRAFYEGIGLPAVTLYKVGQIYFVEDGHHRVSIARKHGQVYIEAEVREFRTRCNLTSESRFENLELLCPVPI